ncbi:cytochrome c oxidase assembly protein [Amycolatopsis thermalba]|uniref:Cytochrome c oxidase assembly protein n=1 Tax=Amycolatopsis thermalba TaxID=944492 RepID=A0ABY4P0H2_9PSEU|nr:MULTISPECIES: cytochrome c oxidase assembly protein [Amycolatopsis]UQS25748.1 cytochrome c oxidase assembly protein [Amycolatopsis thermalba]
MPDHVGTLPEPGGTWPVSLLVLVALAGYLSAARRWPRWRTVSFTAGALAVVVALSTPARTFTAHMAQHLVVGMAGPLLLVLGRPVTLALRVCRGRRALVRVLRSWPVAVLVFPPVAAVLDVGGLWLLYRTPLIAQAHQPWALAHVFAAGLLFTTAICQVEPVRHRHGLALRGATLVLAGAAHGVLAKTLYAAGDEFRAGAQLMYYGGDAVGIALALVICLRWYRRQSRRRARASSVDAPVTTARPAPRTLEASTVAQSK